MLACGWQQTDTIKLKKQLTSQKNSFPLNPQNQEIHETSSELLISEDLSDRSGHTVNTCERRIHLK